MSTIVKSGSENQADPVAPVLKSGPKSTTTTKSGSRRALKPVNEAPKNKSTQSSLIGKAGFIQISRDAKSKPFKIYSDEEVVQKHSTPDKTATKSSQTEISGDIVPETEDLEFYKDLAEKRRQALDESLKENESLVMENDELRVENSELKSKNESMEETVAKAAKMAEILGPLLDDEEQQETPDENKDS